MTKPHFVVALKYCSPSMSINKVVKNVPYPMNSHGGRRQPMCDPEGCATVLGAVGPPWLTQTLGVGGSGGQPPGSPGGGGGGRWVPQHTYLKMIPMTR